MLMRIGQILFCSAFLSTHLLKSSLVSGSFLSSLCVTNNANVENDEIDKMYMRRAIELATRATGKTSPNPCVGCVIVRNGTVVGEGWHTKAGTAHAEANALLMARGNAAGATAYVSLEPCNHYGRTPPCTHALIRHGVNRVVAGMVDPDPRVSGYGLQYLRDNGVTVDIADEEESNACRSLNAPFVFRVKTERAYCVVLTSVDDAGSICDPLCQSSAQLRGLPVEQHELSAVLHQVAPEINAVLLTSSQFLSAHSTTLTSLPPHITIAITVSCFNEEMAAEVLQVKERVEILRSLEPSTSEEARRWMVLTPDVDAPVASTVSSGTLLGDMSTEMHCYDSCIDKNEVDTDLSSHVIERPLLVSVVKQMAILGFNAILLIADTRKRFSDMQTSGICQKLLIAQSSSVSASVSASSSVSASGSGLVEAADGEPVNHISDSTATPHGNSLDTYRNVVSSILTSMTVDALNGVPNSKTSDVDTDSEEVSLSHPISVIEGAVDPLNYTIENGKFHILRAEKSPNHDIDYSEDIQSNSSSSNSNSNSNSNNNGSTEEETDDEVEEEEVDVNGQEKVRSRRRRLKVFSIRLWS